ncbi:kinase-like domain-containing protein [Ochromonadaceae sp. CCMP2298]|nr:kinase-like domain-containing protein [Ochromonadaceae sp. CCMP2298]
MRSATTSRSSVGTYSRLSRQPGPEAVDMQSYSVRDKRLFNAHWENTRWVCNSEQGSCFNCASPFSLLLRYHHCRSCGNCICYQCSTFKQLPCFGYSSTRVCKYCCGERSIEVQVDARVRVSDEHAQTGFARYSPSKEARHQTRSVRALVAEGIFAPRQLDTRASDYSVSHAGVTHTRPVEVKCFRRWVSTPELVVKELDTLRILHHPNISRVIRTNIHSGGCPPFPYIMFECPRWGALSDFLTRNVGDGKDKRKARTMQDWHLLLRMLTQLAAVLRHLHQVHQIMHNDLHAGTVLVCSDRLEGAPPLIKLNDFVNSRPSDMQTSQFKPLPTHRAAEVWSNGAFDVCADVFSFGQTVAQVLLPKRATFMHNYGDVGGVGAVGVVLGNAIVSGVMPPIGREKSAVGLELADVVRDCWQESPDRPSFETLEARLTHMEVRYFPCAPSTI